MSGTSGASGAASSSSGNECPDVVPATCPPSPPTYAKDVAPLVLKSCTPCHAPGGTQSSRLLTTYPGLVKESNGALLQVAACRMPPRGFLAMTDEARTALLGWVVCGAKND